MSNFQAHCHWCNDPVYAESVDKVKVFWNHKYSGYPICDWCSKGLKTDGSDIVKEYIINIRKQWLEEAEEGKGLIVNDNNLDKWL